MEGKKRIFYQALRDFIHHIPGGNPSQFTLCGTNCFVLGAGKQRVLIESGDYPERNQTFLENFRRFLDDYSHVRIGQVFVTHAHYDHFGGVYDVLRVLEERGHPEPTVLKHIDGNKFETEVFARYPMLAGKVKHLKHGDSFELDDHFSLRALHTPGHATDHFSIMMESRKPGSESYLFSGDIILGTPSTSVQDLKPYMESLYNLRKETFEHICLPHSVDEEPCSILVEGKPKLEAYIKYREDRDQAIISCFTDSSLELSID